MKIRKTLAGIVFASVLVGTFVASKSTDFEILQRVVRVSRDKIASVTPDAQKLAGPLAAFRIGNALPIEERVRVRIQNDKHMLGGDVTVLPTATTGEVRLRGIVETSDQRNHALVLAESTKGVEKVLNELAVPEGK